MLPSIPVGVVDIHPMDLFSLQELLVAAIYLLLFVSHDQGNCDHPKFSKLRKLLAEILVTVPLSEYFSSSNLVGGHCIENYADTVVPILLQQHATRQGLRDYVRQSEAACNSLSDRGVARELHQRLDAIKTLLKTARDTPQSPGSQPHDILSLLATCHHLPVHLNDDGLKLLIEVLGGPLQHARAALQAELTPETYHTFLGSLAVGLESINDLSRAPGKYYNPEQTELGPLNDALLLFRNNETVRAAKQRVVLKAMAVGGAAGLVLLVVVTGSVLNPVVLVLGLILAGGLLVGYLRSFPARVLKSSAGLREAVFKHLKLSVTAGATVGEMESMLASHLNATYGFGPFRAAEDFKGLAFACFPYVKRDNIHCSDVARRLKLTVLCAALRDTLKQLPLALVIGPPYSGKSTFCQHMQIHGRNRQNYGPGGRHTSVPELFFCGEPDRPIGLLDSVGLGDPTKNEVFAAIELTNKIFRLICQASVIVVSASDASSAGRYFMGHTSAVPPRTPPSHVAPVHHPTITCITHADLFHGGFFPEGEDGPATLLRKTNDCVVRGEPFDLRSPQEDPFTPRVLACFQGQIQLPEEYDNVVYTAAQVREWLYSHCYPSC
jgi:hypothetical protein